MLRGGLKRPGHWTLSNTTVNSSINFGLDMRQHLTDLVCFYLVAFVTDLQKENATVSCHGGGLVLRIVY